MSVRGEKTQVVSMRFKISDYALVQEVAAIESLMTGKTVTAQELIRDAVNFVYRDGERLRECFRRGRAHLKERYFKES